MKLVGILARPIMAAPFVLDGIDAVTNPAEHVEVVKPLARDLERYGIPPVLTADLTTAARITGGATILAGLSYALGRKPLLSMLALSSVAVPVALVRNPIWTAHTREEQQRYAAGLVRSAAALTGLALAAWKARR